MVTARFTKKAVGSFGLPTARLISCSQALWADLPKEAKKAKKSEKAAHVDVPVHDVPLVQSFYLIATGPVNTFFPMRPAPLPSACFRPGSCWLDCLNGQIVVQGNATDIGAHYEPIHLQGI